MLKKYSFVSQDDLKDCGVASLLMIIRTYGGNVPKEYLKSLTNMNRNGTTAFDLLNAGTNMGFTTKGVKGNVEDLTNQLLPCIAHTVSNNYQHFVVIYKIDNKKKTVVVADPAKGIIELPIDDFKSISTGCYFLFIPNKTIPNIKLDNKVANSILQLFFKYKNILSTILIFSLIYTLINILTSFNFQFIIEQVINYQSKNNLYAITLIMISLILIKTVADWLRNNLFNYIKHELDYMLIKDIFSHIISLPYLYYKSRTTGEIISRINDLGEVKDTLSRLFITFFVDLVLVILVFINLFRINKNLALISVLILLAYWIIIKIFKPILNKLIKENREESAKVNSYLFESINGLETIKNLGVEDNIANKFDVKYNEYLNNNYKFNKIYNLENFFKDIINYVGVALIISIGSYYVLKGNMSLGSLITFSSLIVYFLEPIKNFIDMELIIRKAKISITRVNELYGIKKEIRCQNEKSCNNRLAGSISVKNLSYSYNADIVIDKLNMDVLAKEKVIIYGRSGCGKSTLAKLLIKYFDIDRETITIDSKDINDYSLVDIRSRIGYVSQNEQLFTDSIYNNIVLSRTVDYDYFLEICKLTKVDEIVKSNILSYNMMIEENGFNLSGGERQRIILARALIEPKDIYIFDECLSQLDIAKEREILINIFTKYKSKTIIFISHRFNNNDLFDKKINMERKVKYA